MTTQTFTATDVAEFGEMIRPMFERFTKDGMTGADAATASALVTRERFANLTHDALGSEGSPGGLFEKLVAVLGGTYDEFRAEAQRCPL